MRTARSLTVSPSMLCIGGRGCTWSQGGVPGPGGCVPGPGGHLVPWGCTWSRGVYLVRGGVPGPRGVPGPGGVPGPRGVSAPGLGGVCVPPVNRMTDACKNITLPQLRCGR